MPHHPRYLIRRLTTSPGFTLTVVLTLALGIGATTAVFSLVEGILLRPLPFNNPDRLVLLGDHLGNGPNTPVTAREIAAYSNASTAFSSLGAFVTSTYEVSGGATPETVGAARLTAGVFKTLGVPPILGRVFTPQEEDAHQPLAVIGYPLWLSRYHGDPGVLGSSIVLDRETYSIIGVMPRGFEFPLQAGQLNQAQLWVPMSLTDEELSFQNMGYWGYQMLARLKDGVTLQRGAEDANRVSRQIMSGFPPSMSSIHIRGDVTPLLEQSVAETRPLLRILFLAVSIVLVIACANVAGLLLVRAIRQRREYAVRLAVGASSKVIVGESVLEGLLLSLAGGLLGLAFAAAAIRATLHFLPDSMPRVNSISVDVSVAAFALLLSLATGALCSLSPAFAALRTNLAQSLTEGTRTGRSSARHTWLRSALVVSEIAIALVLLNLSGVFLRSFQKMRAVDPGFRPDHVLVAGFQLPLKQYATQVSVDAFDRALIDRLGNQPGIAAAGIANSLPGPGFSGLATYTIEGEPAERWKLKFAPFATTYGDYFRAMGIRLLDGRAFTMEDRSDMPLVVIVNQSMARHCWPGQRAIGRRLHVGNPHKGFPWATVVGVVADTKLGSRDQPSSDQWYIPAEQPAILHGAKFSGILTSPGGGYITIRSVVPAEQMAGILRSACAGIDPQLALYEVHPMSDVMSNVEASRRFNTGLITGFTLAALLLAITGIYAVVAFSASFRTEEIAIRMALGAQRGGIARLVLTSGAKIALAGCGFGLLASLSLSRLVSSFLFDTSATDPLIYTASVVMMVLIALLASALPAFRAASANPIDALR